MKAPISTNELYDNLQLFTKIEDSPIPDKIPIYVFCDNGDEIKGFAECEEGLSDLGFNELIAVSWILEDTLLKVLNVITIEE